MLFEKEKYYKYIKTLENSVNFYYVILITLLSIIGIITGKLIGLIIGAIIGYLIARICTLKTKITIQKLKWEIDVYEIIKKRSN